MKNDAWRLCADRREQLAEKVGEAIVLLPSATPALRNHDVEHPFRQNSNFYYLTGFDEPGAILLLDPAASADRFVLFVRPQDREREIWDGRRAGVAGAINRFGAEAAYPADQFEQNLRQKLVGRREIYLPFGNAEFRQRVLGVLGSARPLREHFGQTLPTGLSDLTPLLAEMRLRKTPAEIALLRTACQISSQGHAEAMRFVQPGRYEYQVQAALEYVFRMQGARREGYPSIVASGDNACILHYTENDRQIQPGDLVLIDAGAEYGYFSSDITRTFPAGGQFSAAQKQVYEVVRAAHQAGLETAQAGASMKKIHQEAVQVITEGLVELGLLPGPVEDRLSMHHYREFFMHGTGHWLGMDVHDAGTYRQNGQPRPLEPGMVFTVEPGIYVDPERETVQLPMLEYDPDEWMTRRVLQGATHAKHAEAQQRQSAPQKTHPIPAELRGIGIRIEDDVLITETGHEVLTAGVPSDPDLVEDLCAQPSTLPFIPPR